jgi:hypothetical protein
MIDANENTNDSEGGIRTLLQESSLIDIFSEINDDVCNISTYIRGSRKIDYIFTSDNLLPFIKNVGRLPFYMYNNSDHRGLFLDISHDLLDNKVELKRPEKRHIGTNNSGNYIYNYKKYIDKQFRHQNIYNISSNLSIMKRNKTLQEIETIINKLDNTITGILLNAEKKCCKARYESDWSVAVHISSLMCKYWLKLFKGEKIK